MYERAIANTPPADEKRYWQRYIYLWINYALFEELEAQDAERTREVYRACLKLIPHKAFTFAKASPHGCSEDMRAHAPACHTTFCVCNAAAVRSGCTNLSLSNACASALFVIKQLFLQMWILAAQFEVRQMRLDAARRILGMSLGMCPKDRTYKAYIEVSFTFVFSCTLLKSFVSL